MFLAKEDKQFNVVRGASAVVRHPVTKATAVVSAGVGSMAASSGAFAIAAAQNAAVTTAFTDGSASVQLVVAGIITLAATLTGVALIYKWLSK